MSVKTTLTKDGKIRETIGKAGLTAVLDEANKETGVADVMIELEFDETQDLVATVKEILKLMIDNDRVLFAQAVYQACADRGFITQLPHKTLGTVDCLLFAKKPKAKLDTKI